MSDNYCEPEDLLSDEAFLSWYYRTGEEVGRKWELWMKAHPEKASLVEKAIEILHLTRLTEKDIPADQLKTAEMALFERLHSMPAVAIAEGNNDLMQSVAIDGRAASPSPILPIYRDRRWIAAACILLALSIGLVITYSHNPGRSVLKTAYGQLSQRRLPDGTQVTLNANSRLSYESQWKEGADREVWMNGEAFFQVSKTPAKSRFIVHMDHFDIVVTGTRFNAVNRTGRTSVMLEEGKVLLRCCVNQEMELHPGEFAEFRNGSLQKRTARQDSIMAWKDQRLFFDRTTLRDLATIINDHYGIRVDLADASIGDSTITAIMANDNLDELLRALAATGQFDVIHQPDGSVTIGSHGK